jgi:hypothetical protein
VQPGQRRQPEAERQGACARSPALRRAGPAAPRSSPGRPASRGRTGTSRRRTAGTSAAPPAIAAARPTRPLASRASWNVAPTSRARQRVPGEQRDASRPGVPRREVQRAGPDRRGAPAGPTARCQDVNVRLLPADWSGAVMQWSRGWRRGRRSQDPCARAASMRRASRGRATSAARQRVPADSGRARAAPPSAAHASTSSVHQWPSATAMRSVFGSLPDGSPSAAPTAARGTRTPGTRGTTARRRRERAGAAGQAIRGRTRPARRVLRDAPVLRERDRQREAVGVRRLGRERRQRERVSAGRSRRRRTAAPPRPGPRSRPRRPRRRSAASAPDGDARREPAAACARAASPRSTRPSAVATNDGRSSEVCSRTPPRRSTARASACSASAPATRGERPSTGGSVHRAGILSGARARPSEHEPAVRVDARAALRLRHRQAHDVPGLRIASHTPPPNAVCQRSESSPSRNTRPPSAGRRRRPSRGTSRRGRRRPARSSAFP